MKCIKKYKWIVICIPIMLVAIFVISANLSRGENNVESAYGNVSKEAMEVSLVNLIATPEKYDGKLVRVVGVGKIKFECNCLYLSKEDYKKAITKNAVWLDIDEEKLSTTYEELKKLNGKYILVEGIFNSKKNGHFDMYSGTVENITRYECK